MDKYLWIRHSKTLKGKMLQCFYPLFLLWLQQTVGALRHNELQQYMTSYFIIILI